MATQSSILAWVPTDRGAWQPGSLIKSGTWLCKLAEPAKHSFDGWTNTCSFSNRRLPSNDHVKSQKLDKSLWCFSCVLSRSVMSNSLRPMDCSLPGSSVHGGFSRQEYWSGFPCPSSGDLPNPGIKPRSPALQADSSPSEPSGKPKMMWGRSGFEARTAHTRSESHTPRPTWLSGVSPRTPDWSHLPTFSGPSLLAHSVNL